MSGTSIKKMLIFDDDADFRKLLVAFLKKSFQGIDIEEYDPVARGIPGNDFDWSQYDVLLLDYHLSVKGVTGLDVLRANRKNQLFPATIMLTGAGNEEVAVRALKAGVYDYLRKEKLNKNELRRSILDAHEKHKGDRKKFNELTHQSKAFNKALFYQKLELKRDNPDFIKRIMLLIELDNHEVIEKQAGLIFRDNIVRHIARQSFEIFKLGECNPSITRLSDIAVALLIDDPASGKTLEFNLNGLCTHLRKHPYKYEGKKYRFSVNIGVVPLTGDGKSAREIIQLAQSACALAANEEGNCFHINREKSPAPAKEALEAPTAEAKTAEPEPSSPPVPAESLPPKEEIKPVASPEKTRTDSQAPGGKPESPPKEPQTKPRTATPARKAEAVPVPAPAPAPAETPAPAGQTAKTAAAGDEVILDESELSEKGRKLKKAFEEKRVMQTFQPLISLTEIRNDNELQYVSLQAIDTDGNTMDIAEIEAETKPPVFKKYIDRWLLREIIGRVINRDDSIYTFIIRLGADSLADPTLFNWLLKLLSGLGTRSPGGQIALEITAGDFMAVQKQAVALINYLRKTHGFKFMLSEISGLDEIKTLSGKVKFDFFKMKHEVVVKFSETPADAAAESDSILDLLKSKGANIIADGVEDATALTEVITLGVDFAMGFFIGEPAVQLEDTTNIESFEII